MRFASIAVTALIAVISAASPATKPPMEPQAKNDHLTVGHRVHDIVKHPAFNGFGEHLLPWADNARYYDTRLERVGSLMPYHSHVDADVVVVRPEQPHRRSGRGKTIFDEFYTERQKQEDPAKRLTGLFFYRGKPGSPFAIVCPGGGFSYVGSLHEGFPLAREISRKGLNAFVIRYRVDERGATEDLAAAVSYVFRNAEKLGVDTRGYSLWGAPPAPGWSATSPCAASPVTAATTSPGRPRPSSPTPGRPAFPAISRRPSSR